MNERIQKWLENHLVRSEYTEFGWQECHRYEFDEHELEKFAELIVQECAKSANDWYQNHDKIHSDPMSYVLAHFGVEE